MPDLTQEGLAARGLRVRALEWEPSVIGKPWHSAKAPWGWYYAQWDDETQAFFASLEMGEIEAPIILSPSDVPTLEAAKAAAKSDYAARILAALEDTGEPALIREAEARGMERGMERAAELVEGSVYTSNGSDRALEPVKPKLRGMDMHHATIAAAIRAAATRQEAPDA